MRHGFLAPLFVLLIVAGSAAADPKQDAADLAAQSAKHYKRGEFEQAAALLREAYEKFPEPNLLYNLARALEGFGDRVGAIEAYEKYLATGRRIEDRGGIERRVATLKAELEALKKPIEKPIEKPVEKPASPAVEEPAPVAILAPEPEAPKQRSRTKLPWITIAGGAAIAAIGGVMAFRARSNDNKSDDAMSGIEAEGFHDKAKRDALAANILFGVGGAVMITGVVIAW